MRDLGTGRLRPEAVLFGLVVFAELAGSDRCRASTSPADSHSL
jgi:hypothetical protein